MTYGGTPVTSIFSWLCGGGVCRHRPGGVARLAVSKRDGVQTHQASNG